jgi:hypothetical protein
VTSLVQIILTALFYAGQGGALVILWLIYQQNRRGTLILQQALADSALKTADTARVLASLLEKKELTGEEPRKEEEGEGP